MSHDNPMMIMFVRNGMTLKTTLLLCDQIDIVNTLVSCIISLEKRFRPLITLTATNVTFSTNTKLCCHTNSLSMKHVNALEPRCVWVHTIVDLPPLIVMGNKNKMLVLKTRLNYFERMMH
jgi:hypothetical protein